MSGSLLVPHEYEPDILAVVQAVEDRDDVASGEPEDHIHFFAFQALQ
jgi:hypothetical protein